MERSQFRGRLGTIVFIVFSVRRDNNRAQARATARLTNPAGLILPVPVSNLQLSRLHCRQLPPLVVRYERSLTIYSAFFYIACFMIVLRRVLKYLPVFVPIAHEGRY